MEMMALRCPNCGAAITLKEKRNHVFCEYCGTQILVNDGVQRIHLEYVDEARIREVELEEKKFDAAQIDRIQNKESREEWKRLRSCWLIGSIIGFAAVGTFESGFFASLGSAWIVIGGLYIYFANPDRGKEEYVERTYTSYSYRYEPMPWYLKTGWILFLGYMSGGIWWIAGPIKRSKWKKRHGWR